MIKLPTEINQAVHFFSKLPGIGEKTATRHSLVLSGWTPEQLVAFANALKGLALLGRCSECDVFSETPICNICSDPSRVENGTICVVEGLTDCLAIERSEKYRGQFHILGGVLNPLLGVGPENLRIKKLLERIQNQNLKEVVFAINPSVEGDATSAYLKQEIEREFPLVRIKRIGLGIPLGGSLEYVDPMTISMALEYSRMM